MTPQPRAVDEHQGLELAAHRFGTSAMQLVRPRTLTSIRLRLLSPTTPHVSSSSDDGVRFCTRGWYEVLLKVEWDRGDVEGTRFSHTKVPDQEPLHSEAINAAVLHQISEGRQLLRGNAIFGPDAAPEVVLEVWHDSPHTTTVGYAELLIRELQVPWPPALG